MCHCFICNNLLYVPVDCFVEVASAGFYFGCKVKHLLSCSVSTGSIQRVIIALVYSVNVCQMDCCCCSCMYREWSSLGKREKKKEEALWFPPSVLLPCSTVGCMLLREMLAVTKPEGVIVFLSLVRKFVSISCHGNHMRKNYLHSHKSIKYYFHHLRCILYVSLSDAGQSLCYSADETWAVDDDQISSCLNIDWWALTQRLENKIS